MLQKSISEELLHADICIKSAKLNLEHDIIDACVNRMYYAVFHAARALVLSKDIVPKSHKGVYTMLSKEFVATGTVSKEMGKMYFSLMDMRATADYGYFASLTEEEVLTYLPQVEAFVARAKALLDADA